MIEFNLIKGRIQKHRLSSIIHKTLELLNQVQRSDDKRFPIWHLFALIKWTYIHTNDSILRLPIEKHEYHQLLELIGQFEAKYDGLCFGDPALINKSLKIIANQQFALQDRFHNSVLSRQIVLYLELYSSSTFDLDNDFKQLTGFSIKTFLEYSYFTFFFFNFEIVRPDILYNGDLAEDYFDMFVSKWGNNELEKYLDLLTLKSKNDFEKLHKLKTEVLHLFETNFFTLKPFIFFRNQYRIPHKQIFTQTIKHFIYNYLKENLTKFPEEFGKRLEQYVQLGLVENNIPHQNETALKTRYQLKKVSDFLVEPDVLIEVKAMELHPRSGVLRTKEILVNDLDATIIKAYTQLLETAFNINSGHQFYGVIITYKDMYLGFGKDAWEEFLKEPIEIFCLQNSINISVLPPENLCFISIENWDQMMQAIKDGKATLKQMLQKGKELNSLDNPIERMILMEQVIDAYFQSSSLSITYLRDKHLKLDILQSA